LPSYRGAGPPAPGGLVGGGGAFFDLVGMQVWKALFKPSRSHHVADAAQQPAGANLGGRIA
jgi:hypothetical protein